MQIPQKDREGNFYFPGTILKQFGHCLIYIQCAQLMYSNYGYPSYGYWKIGGHMFLFSANLCSFNTFNQ